MTEDPESDRAKMPAAASDEEIRAGLEGRRLRAELRARMFGAKPDGVEIGSYRLGNKIGEGGMASVYRARHISTDETVAVKVVRTRDAGSEARLRREGRAMLELEHPNVVRVHEVGQCDEGFFMVMDLVEGTDLRGWFKQPREWVETCRVISDAAAGLAAAHALGVVHRDVKPDNILIGADGTARVADFGLARALPDSKAHELTDFAERLTATGAALGTVGYMAPEQLLGRAVSPATDQFALAATAYEALFGKAAFRGNTADAVAIGIINGQVQGPPDDSTGAALHRELVIGLAPDPQQRHPTIESLAAALQRALNPREDEPRRWWSKLLGG